MLKPVEPGSDPDAERPLGEIVGDLVDEGKAYARAELQVVKAIAAAKANAVKTPLILLGTALLLGLAALNLLALVIFVALAALMTPLLAGVLAFLIVAGAAALLGWLGVRRLGSL